MLFILVIEIVFVFEWMSVYILGYFFFWRYRYIFCYEEAQHCIPFCPDIFCVWKCENCEVPYCCPFNFPLSRERGGFLGWEVQRLQKLFFKRNRTFKTILTTSAHHSSWSLFRSTKVILVFHSPFTYHHQKNVKNDN